MDINLRGESGGQTEAWRGRKNSRKMEMGRILEWEGEAESANIVDWLLSLFVRILS